MKRARTWGLRIVRTGVAAYLCAAAVLFFMQDSLIFPRGMIGPGLPEAELPADVDRHWIDIDRPAGARVEVWFLPGRGCDADHPGPSVVLLHGNGELIDDNLHTAELYRRLGVNVLMPEYRGYGRGGGSPSQDGIVADLVAARAWLLTHPGVDPKRVVYHGESLGTGFACELARVHPPAVLILNSPFLSMSGMAHKYLMPAFLVRTSLRSDLVIAADPAPLLVFHGSQDNVVPVAQGRSLAALSPRSEFVELDCGHNDLPPDWDTYAAKIAAFLRAQNILPPDSGG